ncbi:hypothetical protein [uncultured Aquabacterium sp.]|uniref:hypothetical protein n=1 Tax=uncultured Aquabacterium sp. TaxID=158753 RepID=UPI002633D0E2|nr:hypothetical protein [uncultured Aquabacterium sp.]
MSKRLQPYEPLTYANMTPEERARRQAIMDMILEKHARETRASAWLKEQRPKLLNEVKAWEDSVLIRNYVAMLDQRAADGGEAVEGFEAWRTDALKVADALDPTQLRVRPKP